MIDGGRFNLLNMTFTYKHIQIAVHGTATNALILTADIDIDLLGGWMIAPLFDRFEHQLSLSCDSSFFRINYFQTYSLHIWRERGLVQTVIIEFAKLRDLFKVESGRYRKTSTVFGVG